MATIKWCSHVDLHHELPPSQSGVQNYLHLESKLNAERGTRSAERVTQRGHHGSAFRISRSAFSKLASVAGLAPARVCLKGRLRELLCIHGRHDGIGARASARFASQKKRTLKRSEGRAPQLVPGVGIAPTSSRLQRGANLSQLPGDGRPAR